MSYITYRTCRDRYRRLAPDKRYPNRYAVLFPSVDLVVGCHRQVVHESLAQKAEHRLGRRAY